jgi:hypothetical protein
MGMLQPFCNQTEIGWYITRRILHISGVSQNVSRIRMLRLSDSELLRLSAPTAVDIDMKDIEDILRKRGI